MKNRFANIGNIMEGDSYIQRDDSERILLARTVNDEEYGSINIVGLHRMGKSSLVQNALVAKAEDFYKQKNIIVAKISAASKENVNIFFRDMAKAVYKIIKKYGDVDDELNDSYEDVKKINVFEDGTSELESFFEIIKESGKRVVLIIDEFDKISNLFKNYQSGFGVLRELASQGETKVAFVFVSKRTAAQIEEKCEEISSFHNILKGLYLKSFSGKELDEYFRINECSGVELSDEEKKKLVEITGGQPYWSDILLEEYKKAKDEGENADLEMVFQKNKRKIYKEYESMISVLNESEKNRLGNKLYQIVFGPMEPDCTELDIEALYDYGIIVDKENKKLISDKFKEYMELKEREVNFYRYLHDIEINIRKILKLKLLERYKENWEKEILEKYTIPGDILKDLKKFFDLDSKNKRQVGVCSHNGKNYSFKQYLLASDLEKVPDTKDKMKNASYTREDADITILEPMSTKSLLFLCEDNYYELKLSDIFGKEKNKFVTKADHIGRARNTVMHSNDILLTDEYKRKTREFCDEFFKRTKKFCDKNNI